MSGLWRDRADHVLGELFRQGTYMPTDAEIRDAYPFVERRMWPYKVWLKAVREWRIATEKRMNMWESTRDER